MQRCIHTERNTRLERTVSFRDKNLPTLPPYLGASIPSVAVGKISSMEDGREWLDRLEAPSTTPSIYIYIYILAGSRGDPRGCKWWTPDPEQILARKNSPWPWATLSTYYDTSKAVEHFSGSTSGQCELQLHRLSTAPPHLTKPRATNCNPCKHDALRCSLHSWLLVSSACPTPPSFLPSFLARFLRPRAIFDDFPNRDPLSDSASYLGSSVSLSFSSSSFSFFSPPSVSRVIRIGLEESFLDLSRSLLAREKSSRFIESFESTVTVSSLSRRAVVINNPDARVEGRDWMMSRGWCHAACTQAKRMKRAWKNFFCQYLPFNSRVQALVASETVVHRNRRRGQGQGREREREKGCLLCNFIKRRVLLAHEENSFVFRAKESRRIPPFYPSIADNYVDNYNLSLSII